ncbi:hypothetical protein, partial [Gilliamella sp. M0320]|uniref:hypothetical protein n=1 Tax=Gilliamella sp. M0320 TaxID=2750965 RepID=UPI001E4F193F
SLSCQHVANVAKLNTPNLFAKINSYVYSELILVLKPISGKLGRDFLALKTPFLNFLGSISFGRFVVLRLFLYGEYVRVKRVGANPLYNLPPRPRKWSRCDYLPPSFALNAPCQTSLFAMLTSLSCQHIANVAPQNRFYCPLCQPHYFGRAMIV